MCVEPAHDEVMFFFFFCGDEGVKYKRPETLKFPR